MSNIIKRANMQFTETFAGLLEDHNFGYLVLGKSYLYTDKIFSSNTEVEIGYTRGNFSGIGEGANHYGNCPIWPCICKGSHRTAMYELYNTHACYVINNGDVLSVFITINIYAGKYVTYHIEEYHLYRYSMINNDYIMYTDKATEKNESRYYASIGDLAKIVMSNSAIKIFTSVPHTSTIMNTLVATLGEIDRCSVKFSNLTDNEFAESTSAKHRMCSYRCEFDNHSGRPASINLLPLPMSASITYVDDTHNYYIPTYTL